MPKLAAGVFYLGTVGKPEVLSTYAVGGGKEFALLEPGPSNTAEECLSLLQASGIPLESVTHVFVTHVHLDHAGGVWRMLDRLPNAKVLVYSGGGKHLVNPERLSQGAEMVLGPLYRLWGEMKGIPVERIREVTDGEVILVGGHHLRVIYSPGHSPYHMSVLDSESGSLFTGDAVGMYVGSRETIWPASPLPSFRYDESMETLGSLKAESPRRLLIPHYEPQGDVRRIFDLNKEIYEKWFSLIGGEPPQKDANGVVEDLLRSVPSYSWIPADELTRWIITMHATGFLQALRARRAP
jgi:glyoxylase-like metal-dependent hydrolase (beta-lactamase superfamily II)